MLFFEKNVLLFLPVLTYFFVLFQILMTVQMSAVLAKEHVEIYKAVFGVNVFPITMGNCVRTVRVFLFNILESVFLSHYEKS